MSIYRKIAEIGTKYIGKPRMFKYGFNLSPMYRRSTAKIVHVSKDICTVKIKLPLSYKNKNYVNSIFGGSMFAAVDPIPMIQLMHLLGDAYIVWDKTAQISFLRPAKEDLYADFLFTHEEIEEIKQSLAQKNELEVVKTTSLTNKDQTIAYCKVEKTIYVANKAYFKNKRKKKKVQRSN